MMNQKEISTKSIKTKSSAQGIKAAVIRTFASTIIALSGCILYTDKVFSFQLENNHGFQDSETFIWVFTQSISPLLLILGTIFKPYRIAYSIPVYMYAIQLIWVFNPNLKWDNAYLQLYAIGTVIGFILLVLFINFVFKTYKTKNQQKISFLEQALDLSIKTKKSRNNEE